jgi:hypothetical protein
MLEEISYEESDESNSSNDSGDSDSSMGENPVENPLSHGKPIVKKNSTLTAQYRKKKKSIMNLVDKT